MIEAKIELNTGMLPIFTGTYGGIWEVYETNDNGDELETEYTTKDLMESITRAYQNKTAEILRDINDAIDSKINYKPLKSINFTGTFYSPREYNFSTDVIDFTIELQEGAIVKLIESLSNNDDFKKYLSENFTSRDGFWSYTPNNMIDLTHQLYSEGDEYEQSICAILSYLIGTDAMNEIEQSIMEDWQGNGYAGLDYKIIE